MANIQTKEEYQEYIEKVNEFKTRWPFYSTLRPRCPWCDRESVNNVCECGFDFAAASEPYFSKSPCECCGDVLHGDRVNMYCVNREWEEHTYSVCVDCEYAIAYGRLDDTTMERLCLD